MKGFYFKDDECNGEDFMTGDTKHIVVTRKVKEVFEKNNVTGIKFIPAQEYIM